MEYYIYGHYCKDSGDLFYIGKGCKKRAWSKHNRNEYWHNIVHKHGYTVKILHIFNSETAAFNKEVELIKSLSPRANIAVGGFGGDTFSNLPEDKKESIRAAAKIKAQDPKGGVAKAAKMRKGKTKNSCDALKRMAASHSLKYKGSNNPMFGKTFWDMKTDDEAILIKNKISQSLKNTYKEKPRKYKKVKCPHCGKVGGQPGLTRYHFDNCKDKV